MTNTTAAQAPAQTTIADVITFVASQANEDDIERLLTAIKARRSILSQVRAASLAVGDEVTINGISPAVLNNLTGTVKSISGNRAEVELTVGSTERVAYGRHSRFSASAHHAANEKKGLSVPGIPMSCLFKKN